MKYDVTVHCKEFQYHKPNDKQLESLEILRSAASRMLLIIDDECPDSREKSVAKTKLEESIMWANKAVTHNG